SPQPDDQLTTVWEGLKNLGEGKGWRMEYFNIGERSKAMKTPDMEKAAEMAKEADLTILVLGENSFRHDWPNKTTGENIDRHTLQLSGRQLELAQKIHALGKPVIVVLVNGSPISEPWLDENVAAILEAWEPGSFGGRAIAEVLFGEVNPSGKLPLTVPRHVGQLQMVYNHKPTTYIHKYHGEKKTPLYHFGYGLSYTSYQYGAPQVSGRITGAESSVKVSVEVTNTGKMAGEEIVQLYIRDDISSVTRPVKELKGYRRIALKPGETKTVDFTLAARDLAFYNMQMQFVAEPGTFSIMTGPSSFNNDLKKTTIQLDQLIVFKND
ncbi:MAG TPA: glycoside hydrolase family 3 C-terminal domain-containing protein, partial [Saprospiraceae bacterium]|nr:glycoside hydrolase family 3 C-terminal domain-containing protein [Saprospiraceae bacterium]